MKTSQPFADAERCASDTESSREPLSDETLARLADLALESGQLKHTPRTGWAFLGSHSESVAEHSFRTTVLGFLLARLAGADADLVVRLCLFHDLHEARTGDFNYVYHRYDVAQAREAVQDAAKGTGCDQELLALFDEFHAGQSREADLANDADQLDLITNLHVELRKGVTFARDWLDSALARLRTREGRALAMAILKRDPHAWWYGQVPKSWWVHHK